MRIAAVRRYRPGSPVPDDASFSGADDEIG
jgi:hypothetical protein